MANLRAGLIGLGMMGRHHARVLGSLEGVDLVAVADPGGDVHGVAGGRPVLETVEQLIETGIDYCMVAVPTAFHEQVGLAPFAPPEVMPAAPCPSATGASA